MPLIFHLRQPDFEIAAWEISEPGLFFEQQLQLSDGEKDFLQVIKAPGKRLQWLASRHLIRVLLRTGLYIDSNYRQAGKPRLLNHEIEISISHSAGICAVIISKQKKTGIDIEPLSRNVNAVAHKFVSARETDGKTFSNLQKLFVWCAKESLFKLYASGEVSFLEDLYVAVPGDISTGSTTATIFKPGFGESVTLHYTLLNNRYLLCWCLN